MPIIRCLVCGVWTVVGTSRYFISVCIKVLDLNNLCKCHLKKRPTNKLYSKKRVDIFPDS